MDWTSVKDQLPDEGQAVICAAKMDGTTWWFGCCVYRGFFPWVKINNPDPVEFWAYLPAPPHYTPVTGIPAPQSTAMVKR